MRRLLALCFLSFSALTARGDIVATFEDAKLAPNSHLNNAGGGASGVFQSFGVSFNNAFSSSFGGIWSGWAISTETDGTTPGYLNQYSAKPGGGAGGSATYAVGFPYGNGADPFHPATSTVDLPAGASPLSIDLTNTTYAYFSMKAGDAFSVPFGPGSFLKLDIQGFDGSGGTGSLLGTAVFYLADFRDGKSLIVSDWSTVDLSALVGSRSLRFGIQSSDNDPNFGINTPAYFAADNLRLSAVPEPSSFVLAGLGLVSIFLVRGRRARP